jgi:hypothetical protein
MPNNSTSRTIASSWLSKPTKPSIRLLAEEEAKLAALNHQPSEQIKTSRIAAPDNSNIYGAVRP